MKYTLTTLALSCTLLLSCKKMIQYSPLEVRLEEADKKLNAKNIARIEAIPQQDTLRFVVIGDSQGFYDETNDFVDVLNRRNDIDFVVLAGDIVEYGDSREFKWMSQSLRKLTVPFIGVIGNHDMVANARQVYKEMFGAENFAFQCNGSQFVCLNTNGFMTNYDGTVPNLSWLRQQLQSDEAYKNTFVVSHIPPFAGGFGWDKEKEYAAILADNPTTRLSIHGHIHEYGVSRPYNDGIEYLVVSNMLKRSYVVVTVVAQTYRFEQVFY
ncbi:MAG: hypothetical protein JWP88_1216 [Flaviaesturariibacter sp.]|nr:hypothetical protein [Flaviaesturariibacter sp.]